MATSEVQSNNESAQIPNDPEEKKEEEVKKRKEMEPRSEMWTHFVKILVDGRLKKGKCKYCSREIKCNPHLNGTEKVWDAVGKCLHDLFEEYRNIYAPADLSQEVNEEQTQKRGVRLMKSIIAKKMRTGSGSNSCSMGTTKSELDKYLSEDNEDDSSKFDILAWWKVNESRFTILARLARDVLAIPISTVASESVFSTGGRILDDFRTSLTSFMVQALICTQDWLRRSTPINIEEDAEELAKLEEVLIAEYNAGKTAEKAARTQSSRSITKPSSSAAVVHVE